MSWNRIASRALGGIVLTGAALLPAHLAHAANSLLLRAHFVAGSHYTEVQTSTTLTKIDAKIAVGKTIQPLLQVTNETDRFTITTTVRKVYPDGTGLLRFTFGACSVTKDGKTASATLTGYYHEEHLSTSLHLISQKVVGAATVPAAIRGALPDLNISSYPKAPIAVGGGWKETKQNPPFGVVTATYSLQAIGNLGGQSTATVHTAIDQPVSFTSGGLLFAGTLRATDDAQSVVATGQDVVPSHSVIDFKGKLSGSTNGATVKGSFTISGTMDTTPQP